MFSRLFLNLEFLPCNFIAFKKFFYGILGPGSFKSVFTFNYNFKDFLQMSDFVFSNWVYAGLSKFEIFHVKSYYKTDSHVSNLAFFITIHFSEVGRDTYMQKLIQFIVIED